jgi:ABC-type antimicrobial peptide transport system permease subunit
VGVVDHVMHYGLDGRAPVDSAFYIPFATLADEVPQWAAGFGLVVKTAVPPRQLEAAVRRAVLELDAQQPIYDVKTMREVMAENVSDRRFSLLLLGTFAGLALLLAAVGIYGVMSYSVVQRTREIGIRMALGARQNSVLWLVVGQGARLALVGVGIGLVVALGVSRALDSLVYGMSATDPLTYALVALGLGGVAVVASWLPARRAMRVDPAVSLRAE